MTELIDKLEHLLELMGSVSVFFEIGVVVVTAVAAFVTGRYARDRVRRKLKALLNLHPGTDVEISLPIRQGNVEFTDAEKKKMAKTGYPVLDYNFIVYEEAQILPSAQKLLAEIGYDKTLKLTLPDDTNHDHHATNNKFLFGGPLSNDAVMKIFQRSKTGLFSLKCDFFFGKPSPRYEHHSTKRYGDLIVHAEENGGRVLYYGGEDDPETMQKYLYNEGYVVLIKKSYTSFPDRQRGTVFIGFGNGQVSTLSAIKCLTESTDILYRRLRHRKDQFFVIARCDDNGVIDFGKDSFLDITDIMLGSCDKD